MTHRCRHCRRPKVHKNGLCSSCYRKPEVRHLYSRWRGGKQGGEEPTAEEVERIVAEQMKCLPPWFNKEPRED